ncbi:hypothetical protein [Photorhabdus temperata]|uniref:hypothetical protein n=1 Tax=Photorhabdus temperata TaxID=574560 RepID=UPI00038A213A|nr:hypothetical protein [Photorhabdus temperata]EQB99403.1 hypothetical protein B738_17969 [Photorhabdus temperata subsp. temperata M1021]
MSIEKDLKINIKVDDLKNRFKEGSIPLQTDFANLIDIADIGRRAVGKAPNQIENPNSALKLDISGRLEVNKGNGLCIREDKLDVNNHDGINVDNNGVSIKLSGNKDSGLYVNREGLVILNQNDSGLSRRGDDKGLQVKAGNGITVDNDGVGIKLTDSNQTLTGLSLTSRGLKADDGLGIILKKDHGISVGEGHGIKVNTNDIAVKSKNSTIKVESDGISVGIGWGVKVGGEGLDVKAKDHGGIRVDSYGVSVDIDEIINSIIPPGTIVPFFSNKKRSSSWLEMV